MFSPLRIYSLLLMRQRLAESLKKSCQPVRRHILAAFAACRIAENISCNRREQPFPIMSLIFFLILFLQNPEPICVAE